MRKEEEFVLGALKKFLTGSEGYPGEDPPDAYIEICGKRVALEITRLTPISFDEHGVPKNRFSEDVCGLRIIEDLNRKIGSIIPKDQCLLLFIDVPIEHPSKFQRSLSKWIKDNINKLSPTEVKVEIEGTRICARLFDDQERSKTIIGGVPNKGANSDLALNAKVIITDRVAAKEKRFQELRFEGERWLALLNNYELATAENYRQALLKDPITHGFSRIFIISANRDVTEIEVKK